MSPAEVIYQKSLDLPIDKAEEAIDFIDFFKTRHAVIKPTNILVESPTDHEQVQQ